MTIRHLKTARSLEARAEDDAKTRAIVESGLKEIETKGDAAVREMSVKFDKYDRESYRLSEAEIEALIVKVTPREMADISSRKNRCGSSPNTSAIACSTSKSKPCPA